MAPDSRNRFLDADESEDDIDNYDSEEDLRKGGRGAKRRRIREEVSDDDDDGNDDYFSQDEEGSPDGEDKPHGTTASSKTAGSEAPAAAEGTGEKDKKKPQETASGKKKAPRLPGLAKPATGKKNLVVTEKQARKSGVVYLSRIPPFMKPSKLRSLLEPYGKINRTFLSPEDSEAHARRVRAGGNKKRLYTDGWVEFVSKKDARTACDLLNARPIGGKKGSYYRDDVWSLLYLKGFKWRNLTEQIAAENAERESRMRAEIAKTTKENKEFVRNVERAKMLDGIQAKSAAKKRKRSDDGDDGSGEVEGRRAGHNRGLKAEDGEDAAAGAASKGERKRRTFSQVPLAKKREVDEQPKQVARVLSKIF